MTHQVWSAHADQLNQVVWTPGTPACISHSPHAAQCSLCQTHSTPLHGGEVLLAPGKEQEQAAAKEFIKPGYRLVLKPGKKLAADELQAKELL